MDAGFSFSFVLIRSDEYLFTRTLTLNKLPMGKSYFLRGFIVCLSFCLCTFTSVFAQTNHPDYQDGRIWFKINHRAVVQEPIEKVGAQKVQTDYQQLPFSYLPFVEKLATQYAVTRLSRPYHFLEEEKLSTVFLLEFSQFDQIGGLIRELQQQPGVEYAERVPLPKSSYTPNDPSFTSSTQWSLFKINAQAAWDISRGSANVVVAIVDDAVQITHPDLQANIWVNSGEIPNNGIDDDGNGYIDDVRGYDVADGDNNPNPPSTNYSHGTHVAGISGAVSNNGTGIASIGFGIRVMAVKATNQVGYVTHGYDGIVYAVRSGADVINMSWGGPGASTTAQNIINWAYNSGVVLVAAAGNDNVTTQFYPAAYTNVIAVASTASNDAKSSFSNYGTWINVSAPGSTIYSTIPNNTYGNKSGTSMASPLVAGLAGLVLSVNPGMTPADVRNCILSTADNISSVNPSYNGQLGSGRINALAALNCASASLNNAPVAQFTANITNVNVGGSVNFTDQSTYNPTSWSWTFTGGTPASFNGQNPPAIVYNTPGSYAVSLTVTNAHGSDTETKTAYIHVTVGSGCDTLNFAYAAGTATPAWTPASYYNGTTPGQNGWINGVNSYLDRQKAAYFDVTSSAHGYIEGAYIYFARAYSANPNKVVPIRIYSESGTNPATLLATANLTMGKIRSDVQGGYLTFVRFAAPVAIPANRRFYVSVDMTNLQWTSGVKDTLAILSNSQGQSTPSMIWEQLSNNTWTRYGTSGSWNLNASLYVFPLTTDNPASVSLQASALSVCAGESIDFDATGSTVEQDMLWTFNGGAPGSSTQLQPSILYNTPGTYRAYLEVLGGGCRMYAIDSVQISVQASPVLALSTSQDTICPGGSVQLTVSGADTYQWTPPQGLSSTTISNPVASPTQTTTYSVTGTQASCSANASVTIHVDTQNPVADFSHSAPLCAGDPVTFNGAISENASSFSWTFAGGNPGTSVATEPSVVFAASGTYTVALEVTSYCGLNDSHTMDITIETCDVSTGEGFEAGGISAYADPVTQQLMLSFNLLQPQLLTLTLVNTTGQLVWSGTEAQTTGNYQRKIDVSALPQGVYFLRISDGTRQQVLKFFR